MSVVFKRLDTSLTSNYYYALLYYWALNRPVALKNKEISLSLSYYYDFN